MKLSLKTANLIVTIVEVALSVIVIVGLLVGTGYGIHGCLSYVESQTKKQDAALARQHAAKMAKYKGSNGEISDVFTVTKPKRCRDTLRLTAGNIGRYPHYILECRNTEGDLAVFTKMPDESKWVERIIVDSKSSEKR